MEENTKLRNGVMLNAYPDSIGTKLKDTIELLKQEEFKDVFSLFYILPTFFNSDLDRGFSIIDYSINESLVSQKDLDEIKALNIQTKFDIVLNHLSVASPQFKDLLAKGDDSQYKDFFIDWNEFWQDNGELGEEGIMIPKRALLDKLFMRKPGLPVLKVKFPDGTERPYWNTFYQQVSIDETTGAISYLGQMDVNAKSELVWAFYKEVIRKVKGYGCQILRLDAFAYLHKAVGETNFFNRPGTWDYLSKINKIAESSDLILLPEIHAEYGQHLHDEVAGEGYIIYDFFLSGLIIHALEKSTNKAILKWANEIVEKGFKVVNMLGCHDGIPVLDLKGKEVNGSYKEGLLEDAEIEEMIELILSRGGKVKNLYGPKGEKISYYQVNATYYSALGESDKKMLLARAIQIFMPGIPQVWYLDLFVGTNDLDAVKRAGAGGHKEINRTSLSLEKTREGLKKEIVKKQLELLRLRNTHPAFDGRFKIKECSSHELYFEWSNSTEAISLKADLIAHEFSIAISSEDKERVLIFNQA